MIDKSILPPHWAEEFKEDFIKQLEDFINNYYAKIIEQYSEGNMFKVTKSTPSRIIFNDILKTLSLERLVDSGLPEPPFVDVLIYNVINYESINLNPGRLIYEEGAKFLYVFPEKPTVITRNLESPVKARIYYTDAPMGEYSMSISKVNDILKNRGELSKIFVFSVAESRGSVLYVKYIEYTTNVLDFYDTFRKEDAKDILVIPSLGDMVRVYCSDRLIKKYEGSNLFINYMNMPRNINNLESPLSPEFFNEYYPRKAIVYLTMTIQQETNPSEQYFMTINSPRSGVSVMRYLPHVSRYNKSIRSITDIGTSLMEIDKENQEFYVLKHFYKDNQYSGYKYFIFLINNSPMKILKNMSLWHDRIKNINKTFNSILPPINIQYLFLYENILWNFNEINALNDNIYNSVTDFIRKTDVFIVCLHPISLIIKYDVDSYNKTVVNNSFIKILNRYINIITIDFPVKEIMTLTNQIYSVNKINYFEVRVRDGVYGEGEKVVFLYPNNIPSFINPDTYNLINIKDFFKDISTNDFKSMPEYFKYIARYEQIN
ncbi:MAG: hypothetical protein QXF12_00300 [Candidatus Aenigmatarchaeota archaeon]